MSRLFGPCLSDRWLFIMVVQIGCEKSGICWCLLPFVFTAGALLGWVSMPNAVVPNLTSKQG